MPAKRIEPRVVAEQLDETGGIDDVGEDERAHLPRPATTGAASSELGRSDSSAAPRPRERRPRRLATRARRRRGRPGACSARARSTRAFAASNGASTRSSSARPAAAAGTPRQWLLGRARARRQRQSALARNASLPDALGARLQLDERRWRRSRLVGRDGDRHLPRGGGRSEPSRANQLLVGERLGDRRAAPPSACLRRGGAGRARAAGRTRARPPCGTLPAAPSRSPSRRRISPSSLYAHGRRSGVARRAARRPRRVASRSASSRWPRKRRTSARWNRHRPGEVADRLALTPARRGVGPLSGASPVATVTAQEDRGAVDRPGRLYAELAAHGCRGGFIDQRQPGRGVAQVDEHMSSVDPGQCLDVTIAGALCELSRLRGAGRPPRTSPPRM